MIIITKDHKSVDFHAKEQNCDHQKDKTVMKKLSDTISKVQIIFLFFEGQDH